MLTDFTKYYKFKVDQAISCHAASIQCRFPPDSFIKFMASSFLFPEQVYITALIRNTIRNVYTKDYR